MTDRPLIDEVREALVWYDRKCFSGTLPPQPGSLLARLDDMDIVPAGEIERLREAVDDAIAEFDKTRGLAMTNDLVGALYRLRVVRHDTAAPGEEAGR